MSVLIHSLLQGTHHGQGGVFAGICGKGGDGGFDDLVADEELVFHNGVSLVGFLSGFIIADLPPLGNGRRT